MRRKKTPESVKRIALSEAQRIALQNTMRLRDEAARRAAEPFEKQIQSVARAAIKDAGHDPDAGAWRIEDETFTHLISSDKNQK